ncbi:hypothetical protein, partial [Kineococcus glutinatus]|uniref:hypothetical protein n=1 Tax=Kineococcus glutinatus TaxID=1070872 RepID=UPI0031E5F7A1
VAARLVARVAAWPDPARVLLVYALARAFSAFVLDRTARFQAPNAWTGPDPGFVDLLGLWDAGWYRRIAEEGYPDAVVRDDAGAPQQSALAFYPLFPLLVRLLMRVTGLPFVPLGAALALVLGAAAAVVVHRLLLEALTAGGAGAARARGGAWAGVVLLCTYPASPALQVAYTESLALLLLANFRLLLLRRHYLAAAGAALLLGLVRPVAAPLAGVVLVHLARRLLRALRSAPPGRPGRLARERPVSWRQVAALGTLLAATAVAGLLWPAAAWWLTGERDAYLATMGAWSSGGRVRLLRPWWDVSRYLLGDVVGPLVLVAAVAGLVALVLSRAAAVLGPELRAWCLCYPVYLLLVLEPFTNLVRYLLLLFLLAALVGAAGARGTHEGGAGAGA